MRKLIISIILIASVCVYAQTDDKTALKELNQKLVDSYKNNKLDDALKYANQAVELSLKIFGADNAETAVAYSNLAIIQQQKQKYSESIFWLQKSIEIYGKLTNLGKGVLSKSYERLAENYALFGKQNETEESYIKSLELCERDFGLESKETLGVVFGIANFYAQTNNFDKANVFYLRCYKLAVKNFGEMSDVITKIDDARVQYSKVMPEKFLLSEKEFQIERAKIVPEYTQSQPINAGVINGKAKKLGKPEYPPAAMAVRAEGQVAVKVTVDEKGKVIKAIAVSGHPLLRGNAEKAALNSIFELTLMNGKPIKITGTLFYNFVAQ
jgi:TonB family protein